MTESVLCNKLLEFLADKLAAVVGNEPARRFRKTLQCVLLHDSHIAILHLFPQIPGDDESAASINDGDQVVMLFADMDIGDVHMPMFMNGQRLYKTCSFQTLFSFPMTNDVVPAQHFVDRGWLRINDIGIHHHIGATAVSILLVLKVECDDKTTFLLCKPVAVRDFVPMPVWLSFALLPVTESLRGNADKVTEFSVADLSTLLPFFNESYNLVSQVKLNPTGQRPPRFFFNAVYSSSRSAMTESLALRRCSRRAIWRSKAFRSASRFPSNTECASERNCFCQR